MVFKPVVLIVRDGWGYAENNKGNAIANGNTPNHDHYTKTYPSTLIKASGNAVGLPEKTQGGSEVGHLTMGAGRIVLQPLEIINRSITNESFHNNTVLLEALENCQHHSSSLHLMGLFSDQGVHATIDHLYALLKLAKEHNIKNVFIHCFLDGRDVPEKSAHDFLIQTNKQIREIGIGKIASVVGRYYAMDRDKNWDRTKQAFDLLVKGRGHKATNPEQALLDAYHRGEASDYYVEPTVIIDQETKYPIATIKENDSVIFYNFRTDRTRQLTALLTNQQAPTNLKPPKMHFVCMTDYDKKFTLPVAFEQTMVTHNLGKELAQHDLRQLRIAETEKYAHVTFFFNSQTEKPERNEERILIPSPKVASYNEQPEMSAHKITEKAVEEIKKKRHDFILINFANADLVAHSGNYDATVKAVEIVDECVGKIVEAVLDIDGTIILTGDHGNAEEMLYENGEPKPAHTINRVPLTIIGNHIDHELHEDGGLQDIAPTILKLLDISIPKKMTGKSLL
jgi:2,3-bisphosphoglycerate-independent phosphoglycerate mutase